MKFKIFSSQRFFDRVKKLNRTHKKRIKKLIEKIEEEGIHATKIIASHGDYILCEMKSKKPSYRMYIIYNQKLKTFYVMGWEHKNKQRMIINKLNKKLKDGIEFGLKSIFEDLIQ